MTIKNITPSNKFGISSKQINSDAIYVIEKLQENNFDGYIVGGGIRDLILGKIPKDFDIVTNATPEQVRKVFKRNAIIIGRRFKIVHVMFGNINPDKMIGSRPLVERHIVEVSTYRSIKIHQHSVSEHGKIMVDNNYGTQEEDSTRRDFTINALYYDPIKEIIIDYHNGIKDIQNKSLKMIGDPDIRYKEDPVRVLRAIRLAIKLGLEIEEETSKYIISARELLINEHKGRLYEEMLKILLSGHSTTCIQAIKQLKIPRHVFVLFDKIFFNKLPDDLALKIIAKTDDRLQNGNDVSIIFILAGLMWSIIYKTWQRFLPNGADPKQALSDAITDNKGFAYNIGVNKNAYLAMREIWMLQLDLESPTIKKIDYIFNNRRFRQAWHLYSTRHEIGQVDNKIFEWWNSFINAPDDETKIILHDKLKSMISTKRKKKFKNKNLKGLI